jgi:alpha-1,2-mannosyltransferase
MYALSLALMAALAINLAIIGPRLAQGQPFGTALEASGLLLTPRLLAATGVDSWRTMVAAYIRNQRAPGDMYWVFFARHIRFQYPPSSLFLLKLLPGPLTQPIRPEVRAWLAVPSCIAVFVTVLCAGLVMLELQAQAEARKVRFRDLQTWLLLGLVSILGVTYYPLTKGHNLGQIQVFIGALATLALLLKTWRSPMLSGICLGLCCLLKPQFAIRLVWAALRRDWRLFAGFVGTAAIGLSASLYTFGLHNHLQYLEVLRELSRRGECFAPNQSINGLLHRLLDEGSGLRWRSTELAPYRPAVYYGTLLSSALLVGMALFAPSKPEFRASPLDLAIGVCAATMASPLAWEHHYGSFFAVFALALPFALRAGRSGFWVLLAYELVANELLPREILFSQRWTSLAGAHVLWGSLLLFGWLLVRRYRGSSAPPCADTGTQSDTAAPVAQN